MEDGQSHKEKSIRLPVYRAVAIRASDYQVAWSAAILLPHKLVI
jgi:hypothetical protein